MDNAALTKRVLWKLDCHILPPLALVSQTDRVVCTPLTLSAFSYGLQILSTEAMWAMQGEKPSLNVCQDSKFRFDDRIAGLENDTHLKGHQFNIALASMLLMI